MVRNFTARNGRQSRPMRVCRKNSGPEFQIGLINSSTSAAITMTGSAAMAATMSKTRLPALKLALVGSAVIPMSRGIKRLAGVTAASISS